MRLYWLGLLLFFPYSVSAAVSISEVAWMGSIDSANHEWIELHNDGEATDITGWKLVDGMNLNIELSGTVPANSYVVLERTSDVSAAGTAFLIYTGAMVNTGATLGLLRADGSVVDQVPGGENWENIGGDNTTKETAQYTNSGWKTAPATPGSGLVWNTNSETESTPTTTADETETLKNTTPKKTAKSTETVRLSLPGVTLALAIDAQSIGYVHQPISFKVEPSGIGESLMDSLIYQWNFGDGTVALQKDAKHSFQYPGTYVVTVHGGFKRQEQVARHEITILPVNVSLTTNQAGDVQINNDSPYELDISGYRLRGESAFTFPPYSILLPNQTITIPNNLVGKTATRMVGFYDVETTLVSSLTPDTLASVDTDPLSVPKPQISALSFSRPVSPAPQTDFTFTSTPTNLVPVSESEIKSEKDEGFVAVASAASSTQLASAGGAVPKPNSRFVYLALAGVLGLGILGVYTKPRRNEMS